VSQLEPLETLDCLLPVVELLPVETVFLAVSCLGALLAW